MDYVDLDDLLAAATVFLDHPPEVRDYGLLESTLTRPRATVFGLDAYPSIHEKAAALLLSLVTNHGLIDGNKRLGWLAVNLFYGLNTQEFDPDLDLAYDLIMAIASGETDTIADVATVLRGWAGEAS